MYIGPNDSGNEIKCEVFVVMLACCAVVASFGLAKEPLRSDKTYHPVSLSLAIGDCVREEDVLS